MTKLDNTTLEQFGLPSALAATLAQKNLEMLSASEGHLLLADTVGDAQVMFAGVLQEGAIADLLSFFNMFRKTGILHVVLDGGAKALYFQQGEVVFATSNFAAEELTEVLFALGKIEKDALHNIQQQADVTTPLGKLLVERGLVAPKDLWLAVRNQVENIVYNLFSAAQGSFYFEEKAIEQEQILRLSMSTQNMIMEGLRRLDEKALFMRKIVSLDYYPVETGKDVSNLTQSENRLLNLVQFGQLTACELFRRAGMREFDGIRSLYGLLEKAVVRMEEHAEIVVDDDLGQILALYNNLFKIIYGNLIEVNPEFAEELAASLSRLPQPYSFVLRDVVLRSDGTIDGHTLVNNLDGLEMRDKTKLMVDALTEVAYLETMVLRRDLRAEQARPLIARVQESTARARALFGSTE